MFITINASGTNIYKSMLLLLEGVALTHLYWYKGVDTTPLMNTPIKIGWRANIAIQVIKPLSNCIYSHILIVIPTKSSYLLNPTTLGSGITFYKSMITPIGKEFGAHIPMSYT